ncbi:MULTISPECIES: hypothetical protein [Actinobacillus]|uniref:Uncharacterized protein n=3 Tax=Actinobacillus TaxID=713 RepID=B3GXV0_ACTP7|nr:MULTISPECIES: hypothetical protein [Actinobacillus]ACE61665.1 hypothetical protein APP7_1013 [Actinobacillus pleuropneumoniae serovar 7 str. AP76]MCL7722119.1 hypothetical protein [Actinobacillus pleuropneumoniae]MCL7728225.1 hypothetical protein [Actinobacillus pleuropneumoniae]MCL7729752.1 hypothetical protein [Actinobacillus pleuropneumoniae]MCY6367888.1 hypothetical protein [Actinobacillus pleuropneumoniae]
MRLLSTILLSLVLTYCSFGGFQPPKPYYIWGYKYKKFEKSYDYYVFRDKEMRACGMDPVLGESVELKVNLCLEKKGWYLEQGPVCEEKYVWNEPECIKWRAKYSKPNVQPWG